ncbi:MAG: phosphotransferase [Phycicoccus sp.]|nr:phosphotransferase [Phycicoccus sp.]NMM34985.1 phosphotransferase [Phycicoccus sp.]
MSPASTARPSTSLHTTSLHTPGVNYHATSERIHYADLSLAVREAADLALGSPVVAAAPPVTSGFTNAYAGGVRLRDGRRAFLKASGAEFPFPVLSLDREAQVLEALGDQIPAVAMIGAGTSGDGGRVLALDWVEGQLPGLPWTPDEIGLVRSACERVAEVPTSALAALTPGHVVDDLLEDQRLGGALTHGMTLPGSLDLLPQWLPARIDEVLALAADTDALRGADMLRATDAPKARAQDDRLVHCDLRPDNLLIGRRAGDVADRAYVLDWNWVTLGPAWCDWVSVIPSMQAHGHDLGELLDSTPLSRSADPHALDVWLALLAVYMLVCCEDEPPPGATMALRHHQRYYAQVFLDSLATHRGWL